MKKDIKCAFFRRQNKELRRQLKELRDKIDVLSKENQILSKTNGSIKYELKSIEDSLAREMDKNIEYRKELCNLKRKYSDSIRCLNEIKQKYEKEMSLLLKRINV